MYSSVQTKQKCEEAKAMWSVRLKHKIITIQGSIIQSSTAPGIDVCGGAIINMQFSPGIYTWRIKIHKVSRLMAVGFGLLSKIQHNNFLSGLWVTQPLSGLYIIGSDGRAYAQMLIQTSKKGFGYGALDVVKVAYDSVSQRLKFTKEKTQEEIQVKIQRTPEGDRYVPCCYLCPDEDNVVELEGMSFVKSQN